MSLVRTSNYVRACLDTPRRLVFVVRFRDRAALGLHDIPVGVQRPNGWRRPFSSDTDSLVDHVAVRWDNHIRIYAPNPLDYTTGITGIIGRVYLLSEQAERMCEAHGNIVVGMYDMTPTASGKPLVLLYNYKFDAESLKKMKVRDPIGDAYTVFLPWPDYRPEIKQVKLIVKYITRKGEQHVAEPSSVTLQSGDQPAAVLSEKTGPTLERQFDMRPTMPTIPGKGVAQGPPQPMPDGVPVQIDKLMPPTGPALPQANGNRPGNVQQPDAPYQAIVMPAQRPSSQVVQPPPDEWQNPAAKNYRAIWAAADALIRLAEAQG